MIIHSKKHTFFLMIAAAGFLGGCQSKGDRAEEAKAILRDGAFPGAHPVSRPEPPNTRFRPASQTLQPGVASRQAPSPSTNATAAPENTPTRSAAPSSPLKRLGIDVQEGRIIIDPRQTRSFFEELERKLGGGGSHSAAAASSPARDASGKVIEVEEMGIHVGEDRIEIDLNRTRNVLKMWADSLRKMGEELENALEPVGSGGY